MSKHYLQDMKPKDLPNGYHVARWHPNGKVWISLENWSSLRAEVQSMVDGFNALQAPGAITTQFFVWDARMAQEDLEPYKA